MAASEAEGWAAAVAVEGSAEADSAAEDSAAADSVVADLVEAAGSEEAAATGSEVAEAAADLAADSDAAAADEAEVASAAAEDATRVAVQPATCASRQTLRHTRQRDRTQSCLPLERLPGQQDSLRQRSRAARAALQGVRRADPTVTCTRTHQSRSGCRRWARASRAPC